MTLVVTVGAADAESYTSVAEADAYITARGGNTTWDAAETTDKEVALRKGAAYLDNQYRGRWRGNRYATTQALAWPRVDGADLLYDGDGWSIGYDEIPAQVKNATIEAALLAIGGTVLEPTLERGGAVKRERKKVGPIEKETEWTDGASPLNRYTVIEGLLRDLVTGTPGASSGSLRIVRA